MADSFFEARIEVLEDKIEQLSKQLKIATEALELYRQKNWDYEDEYNYYPCKTGGWIHAEKAIKQIKEIEK